MKTEITEPKNKEAKIFRLCLATPALFEKGSIPKWLDKETGIGEPNKNSDLKLRLITSFLGKSISIGGFDLKERQPKKMHKYVPAGAVYYFEILKGTMEEVIKTFHSKSVSELETDKQGFGIAYVGFEVTGK